MIKLSIVTPHYNMPETIKRTIESIPNGHTNEIEHLIIDDCSTDKNYKILQELVRDRNNIKLFKNEQNSGPIITINEGAKKAKGQYIIFLSADDWLNKDFVLALLKLITSKKSVGVIVGDLTIFYEDKKQYRRVKSFPSKVKCIYPSNSKVLNSGFFSRVHGQTALRRDLFNKLGPYDLDLRWNSDLYLHTKIALSHGILYIPLIHGYFSKRLNTYGNTKTNDQQAKTLEKLMLLFSEKENKKIKKCYIKSACLARDQYTLRFFVKSYNFEFVTLKFCFLKFIYGVYRLIRKL